jgi:hypothetical protein
MGDRPMRLFVTVNSITIEKESVSDRYNKSTVMLVAQANAFLNSRLFEA